MMGYEWDFEQRVKSEDLQHAIDKMEIAVKSLELRVKHPHSKIGNRIQSLEKSKNEVRNCQQYLEAIFARYLNQLRKEAARRVLDQV
jgi:hypothetical protein